MKNNVVLFFCLFFFLAGCSDNKDSIPAGMVRIPAGEFIMGSDKRDISDKQDRHYRKTPFYLNEHPQRKLFLDDYYIDIFEVSNLHYISSDPTHTFLEKKKYHPVVLVSWFEAQSHCKSLKKNLPTEAEWEKAARGIDGREYPWGNNFNASFLNMGAANRDTTRTGIYSKGKSPYGVYDMAGNVWEWTLDWYLPYPENDYTSKDFGKKFKVIRGGAKVSSGHYNLPQFFRTAHRFFIPQQRRAIDTGFRCAKRSLK